MSSPFDDPRDDDVEESSVDGATASRLPSTPGTKPQPSTSAMSTPQRSPNGRSDDINLRRTGSGRAAPPSEDGSIAENWKDEEWKRKQRARLEKEMDVELQKVRADSALEREEAYDNLCNSKDRTQTTAIIALFILEVAQLKDLVSYNSSPYNVFFYIVLGFLLLGLLLTIVAGFLLIVIYDIKSRIKKMGPSTLDTGVGYGTFNIAKDQQLFSGLDAGKGDRAPLVMDDKDQKTGVPGTVLDWFRGKEESLEERLLQMYRKCYLHELQATLDFAQSQAEAGRLDRDLVAAAEAGHYLRESNLSFPAEMVEEECGVADGKLKALMDNWQQLKSLRKQGSTLLQRAIEINRRKLVARLLNLQNWVTHLVFTLCLTTIVAMAFGFTLTYVE